MLETLTIRNIAVIDSVEIPFKPGLNVLSGETGAGKSIVLEAISLLLGGRASAELVRSGCDEAVVEGLFSLSENDWMRPRLERLGFSHKVSELLIKRQVSRGGKHRIYVNGELATLTILQELCDGLIDICGQHEHQSLTRAATQLSLLDRYGSLTEQHRTYLAAFERVQSLRKERAKLAVAGEERARQRDFLRFQIEELRSAGLEAGEDEKLQAEKQLLQSGQTRVQLGDAARALLDAEDGVLAAIGGALHRIRALAQLDERARPIEDGMLRAVAEVEEASLSLSRYLENVDLDPERLELVKERLSLIADLRRKYGATVAAMLGRLESLQAEHEGLDRVEERLGTIDGELATAEAELRKLGKKLSASRKKASELLATSVTGELKELRMSDARFSIEVAPRESLEDWTVSGADAIQFLVRTNRGEPARPLGKIASGGELSRLMLAIRRVIADKGGIDVYLFDEIDAGIGGQTAFQVGKKLRSVAAFNQVLCITHLPQVASFANHHLVVRKSSAGKRTVTEVLALTERERREELARMLGGPELTRRSLDSAQELLQLAR